MALDLRTPVSIALRPTERETIEAAARLAGEPFGTFVRTAALSAARRALRATASKGAPKC